MFNQIRTNSPRAWLLAARPKTLTGAAVPVLMGLALAYADGGWRRFLVVPAILCLLFAFVMQVDANFVNDYFDYKKGDDDEHRLGPRRACAQGWVTSRGMVMAIALTTVVAGLIGLPLIYWGGWEMVLVGVCCVVFCFLYTTHLSRWGMGDVLVLLFFGLVPVCATYYIQRHTLTMEVLLSSLACGMVVDTLLMVNNYRDREGDHRHGKRTLVVLIGEKASELLYLGLGLAACFIGLVYLFPGRYFTFSLPFIYLALHGHTYRQMKKIKQGKALNQILGLTARNIFIYGLLFTIGVLIDVAFKLWK
ncbi:MAG: 1,4-dihydroxy-2-naphthoate octaprenyltransferase [Prevotella sp.]|nr:1,4-dihydroxy-2-naphthoate octaprenyltransferase [Prevotella sp.]